MTSRPSDDYARLTSPWKPLPEFAIKNITSIQHRVEIDGGIMDGDTAETDRIPAFVRSGDIALHEDMETSDTGSVDSDMIVGDRAHDFEMEDSKIADISNTGINGSNDSDLGDSNSDGSQIMRAPIIDTDDDGSQHIDTKCVAVATCVANSGDHRKVVSHIFGRNKACTRDLPRDLWIFWCRKHYQRFKYRAEDAENWHILQLGLVRQQLDTFENWGQVRTWTITLRKTEQVAIAKEDKNGFTSTNSTTPCWEWFLVPHLGSNKTFAQVREVLEVIARKFNEPAYLNRDKKLKLFPGVEFLPCVRKAKEVKKPAVKKGEVGYKKITLDQPAFKRKTRTNNGIIKDMALKKGETPNGTPKSSSGAFKKETSTDTDSSAFNDPATKKHGTPAAADTMAKDTTHRKRKSVDLAPRKLHPGALLTGPRSAATTTTTANNENAPLDPSKTLLNTKRRRLTRGYEKGEDKIFTESDDE